MFRALALEWQNCGFESRPRSDGSDLLVKCHIRKTNRPTARLLTLGVFFNIAAVNGNSEGSKSFPCDSENPVSAFVACNALLCLHTLPFSIPPAVKAGYRG